jgi:hypothetical protein
VRRLATRVILLVATTLAVPRMASAQASRPDADRATARALAREGYEAQKHEQYALAADRFERADALVHAPTLLLGLARAQVGLGKLVEAHETYRRILREPLPPGAPAPFTRAVADATREVGGVAARLAWVTLVVKGPSAPAVLLDDAEVPTAALGVRLACNPGAHTLKVSADEFDDAHQSFAIAEGGEQTITMALRAHPHPVEVAVAPALAPVAPSPTITSGPSVTPAPAVTQGAASTEVAAAAPERSSSVQRAVGFTALGIGVAGLAAGGVTGVVALMKHASLSDSCPGGHCSSNYEGQVDTYRTLANVSTAAIIAGLASGVTGVVLLVTAPRATGVNVYASATSAGIAGSF